MGLAEGTDKAEEKLSGGSPPQARVDGTGLPDSNGDDGPQLIRGQSAALTVGSEVGVILSQ